jgi:polyphosphate glucokinase
VPDVLRRPKARGKKRAPKILVVDVGGTHLKVLATGHRKRRRVVSGPSMTAREMVERVKDITTDWTYDAVSIGYPGVVVHGCISVEPHNLGRGWMGFDFRRALGRPVKVINDAAMQALGSYRGGRMLFLGLGAGLGSAMIIDGVIAPMELAHLPYKNGRSYEYFVGQGGLKRLGKKRWRKHVAEVTKLLKTAHEVDDVVIGGGNVRLLPSLPHGARRGENRNAFTGGFRLWDERWTRLDDECWPRPKPRRRPS